MAVNYCTTAASPSGRPERRVVVESITVIRGSSQGPPNGAPSQAAESKRVREARLAAQQFSRTVTAKYAETLAAVKASSSVR